MRVEAADELGRAKAAAAAPLHRRVDELQTELSELQDLLTPPAPGQAATHGKHAASPSDEQSPKAKRTSHKTTPERAAAASERVTPTPLTPLCMNLGDAGVVPVGFRRSVRFGNIIPRSMHSSSQSACRVYVRDGEVVNSDDPAEASTEKGSSSGSKGGSTSGESSVADEVSQGVSQATTQPPSQVSDDDGSP